MKGAFTFTCECTLERNGVEISMKNSKAKNKTIKLAPFTDTTQESQEQVYYVSIYIGNSEEVLYRTRVDGITKIQNRFINEGKLTLEIAEETNPLSQRVHVSSDMGLKDVLKNQKFLLIMIKNAQPDILKSFCNEILEKKKKKLESVPNSEKKSTSSTNPDPKQSGSQKLSQGTAGPNDRIKVLNPGINKLQPNTFKVNRSAIPSVQQPQPVKRNFDSLGKSKSIEIEQIQVTKKFRWTIQNPFENLPELVLINITSFLPEKEVTELKLLNKYFCKVLYNAKKVVDFRKKGDVPPGIIVKLLNTCKNLEKIYLGPSKFLTTKQFMEDITIDFRKLIFIDFSHYGFLNDKLLMKFYYQIKTLETIKIGYYSGITDNVIDILPKLLPNVKGFYIKSANKNSDNRKDKITDTCLARLIKNYTTLDSFSIYLVGSLFLLKALEAPIMNLKTIKFDRIVLTQKSDILLLERLAQLENLEYLKIGRIILDRLDIVLSSGDSEIFKEIFPHLKKLKTLKIGMFTNNYVLLHLSRNCDNLERLVVFSDQVDDEGLSHVLKIAENLNTLDFHKCRSVNGHCLEDLLTLKLEKLIVDFDEYKVKCTRQILQSKLLLTTVIDNRMKKK